MDDETWSIVGTKKRKAPLEPKKPRGRPRFTDKRAEDQQSLVLFISQEDEPQETAQEPPQASSQAIVTSITSSNE